MLINSSLHAAQNEKCKKKTLYSDHPGFLTLWMFLSVFYEEYNNCNNYHTDLGITIS